MEYPEEGALNIYTDGSCLPNPRRGGLAGLLILLNEDGIEEDYPLPPRGYSGATNNQMELEACIEALRLATSQHPPFDRSRYRKIVIHTDSKYVALELRDRASRDLETKSCRDLLKEPM